VQFTGCPPNQTFFHSLATFLRRRCSLVWAGRQVGISTGGGLVPKQGARAPRQNDLYITSSAPHSVCHAQLQESWCSTAGRVVCRKHPPPQQVLLVEFPATQIEQVLVCMNRAHALLFAGRDGRRRKALLIGCNYPGTSAALSGCCNDAVCMEYLLRNKFGYSDIRMLRDDGKGPGQKPTKRNILAGIDWLVGDARAGDSLFFHFSGAPPWPHLAVHTIVATRPGAPPWPHCCARPGESSLLGAYRLCRS
jgi:hypothetical protein